MTDKLLPDIIQPEGLQVAETYLMLGGDSKRTAAELNLPIAEVDAQLKNREVKAYIDRQFNEQGFRNRHRIFGVMDQLINMKLEEIQETGVGTSADILDVMKTYHKMHMDMMKMEAEKAKAQGTPAPTSQTNIQNNINIPGGEDENYMALINKLVG
ncbi:terminase small subunit [Vibrio phage Ceto]|uniref:Terminase small subunit n=1 Tax=Vibrio phage Ceto TaxID=2570300 RepID=A0A2H5BGB4_9CAUD|nr:terminase small subunit [Vibrio phage Ceto]AUG85026.1 hypothetical protein CETO_19 [Vibrio phage Ceto]